MRKDYNLSLLAFFVLTTTTLSHAQSAAVYNSDTTGTLSGIPFTITISTNASPKIGHFDMSTLDYSAAPLSTSQAVFEYKPLANDGDLMITFDFPIQNLRLYLLYWRDMVISFDHNYIILSGNTNVQANSANQIVTTSYANGILEFSGPITTLTLSVDSGGINAYQGFTFADGPILSINDWYETRNNVKIFPNPSSNFIQVSGITAIEHYKIYNLLGLEVARGKALENKEINVDHLVNGVYFLKLENGNTIKFVKNKNINIIR